LSRRLLVGRPFAMRRVRTRPYRDLEVGISVETGLQSPSGSDQGARSLNAPCSFQHPPAEFRDNFRAS
jgi:hypothetical protein